MSSYNIFQVFVVLSMSPKRFFSQGLVVLSFFIGIHHAFATDGAIFILAIILSIGAFTGINSRSIGR